MADVENDNFDIISKLQKSCNSFVSFFYLCTIKSHPPRSQLSVQKYVAVF